MKSPLLLLLSFLAFSAAAQPAPGPMIPREGAFVFGPATALAADEALLPLAHYAAEYLGRPVRQQMTGTGAVVLTLEPGEPSEAYRLEIAPDYIRIGATSPGGAFNGLQALFRLLPPEVYAQQGIPDGTALACGIAADRPKYSYRGMMLDVARTWVEVPMLKRFINLLSYHNINKLHLHLADDDGWRIQIKSHPELAEVGGFRGGDSPVAPVYGKWSEKYGGYYTQDEMRSLIEYAALRNIEIIPEIDLPGHSRCIGSVRPEIRCNYPPDTVTTAGTDYRSAWCVAREENYVLLEEILGEICELFPSPYIHIGGDEVSGQAWASCPKCRARMEREGLGSAQELQAYAIRRIGRFLEARGRKLVGWDEILDSGPMPDAAVMSWRGEEGGRRAAALGHDVIMCPGSHCYLDGFQDNPEREPQAFTGYLPLAKVYSYDPAPAALSGREHIIGVQANLWTEYIPTPSQAEYMLYPRMFALAEVAWSAPETKDYADFRRRALRFCDRARRQGYHTFDLRAEFGERTESLAPVRHLAVGCPVHYTYPWHPDYPADGAAALTDGLRGPWSYGTRWQGFRDTDMEVTVDLGRVRPLRSIAADFIQWHSAWIWLPAQVEFSVSDDNSGFRTLAALPNGLPSDCHRPAYRTFAWHGETTGRYVRCRARSQGFPGGWLFTDEIIVN